MKNRDRLDEGFELLKACSREQASFDLDLEERMMREFTDGSGNRMASVGKMAAVILLCVAVAGVSVAATGGFGRILENFTGTVKFSNGQTMTVEDGKLLDDEGNVIGDVVIEIPGETPEEGEMVNELKLELDTD